MHSVRDVRSLMLNTILQWNISKLYEVLLHASGVFKRGEAFISDGWRARRELLHHWALGVAAAVNFWIYCQFTAQRLCRLFGPNPPDALSQPHRLCDLQCHSVIGWVEFKTFQLSFLTIVQDGPPLSSTQRCGRCFCFLNFLLPHCLMSFYWLIIVYHQGSCQLHCNPGRYSSNALQGRAKLKILTTGMGGLAQEDAYRYI